jgi:hypothetical protein
MMYFSRFLMLVVAWASLAAALQAQTLVNHTVSGPRAQRLNVVFVAEGYTASQLSNGKFLSDMDMLTDYLFSIAPFSTYKPYFNIYGVSVASAQSGADQGSAGGLRNTYFDATFNYAGIDRLLVADTSRVLNVVNGLVPEHDIIIVIVNDTKYGGSGGSIAVTSINASAPEIAVHEIGHSFGRLADEYDYAGSTSSESANTTQETTRSLIRWNAWINGSTPLPTPETSTYGGGLVGLFEGAAYQTTGWYRPTLDSKMKSLGQPFYAVNEEALVLAIYNRVAPIVATTPAAGNVVINLPDEIRSIRAEGPFPAAGAAALDIEWRLNGNVVPGVTGRTFQANAADIGNGTHTLSVEVSDPTAKVRNDPSNLLFETATWTLQISNQGPTAPSGLVATALPNGHVQLSWTDTSDDESGFVVQYRFGSGAFQEVNRTAAGVTQLIDTDTTAKLGRSTTYQVSGIASGPHGNFGKPSNRVTVIPQVAPNVVGDPLSQNILEGSPVAFSVSATGTQVNYQWRRNGSNISGATNPSYSIARASHSHAGSYDCVVSNRVGTDTSAAAMLVIDSAPHVVTRPLSQTVIKDQPTTFSMSVIGTMPMTFQWRFNGQPILGQNNPTLFLPAAQGTDAGAYDCVLQNTYGTAISAPAVLKVLSPPSISVQPLPVTVARGVAASFSVAVVGTAPLTYQWSRDGLPIPGATKSTLSLAKVKDADVGSYRCAVTNIYGTVLSTAAALALSSGSPLYTDHKLAGDNPGLGRWQWVQRVGAAAIADESSSVVIAGERVVMGGRGVPPSSAVGTASSRWLASFAASTGKLEWSLPQTLTDGRGRVALSSTGSLLSVGKGTAISYESTLPTGQADWSRTLLMTNETELMLAAAPGGGAYIASVLDSSGIKRSSVTHGDSTGVALWSRAIRAINSSTSDVVRQTQITDIASTSSGQVVVCGTVSGIATVGTTTHLVLENAPAESPMTLVIDSASLTGFVASYDSNGVLLWALAGEAGFQSVSLTNNAVWLAAADGVLMQRSLNDGAETFRQVIGTASLHSIAACPNGDVAVLARSAGAGQSVGSYEPSKAALVVARFAPSGRMRWVLPVFGVPPTGADLGAIAEITCSASGALFVAATLDEDAPAEFTGKTTFPMAGQSSDAFIARIDEGITFTQHPVAQWLHVGDSLNLEVQTNTQSGIKLQWYKDNVAVRGQTARTLSLPAVALANGGMYSCRATKGTAVVNSAAVPVNIVDMNPRTAKAPEGKRLEVAAAVSGPRLSFTWWKGGVRVFNVGGYSNTTTKTMRIAAMNNSFSGSYFCRVTGEAGTSDIPVDVQVMLPPVITPPTVPDSIVSGDFLLQPAATDAASYKFTNLPPGLFFDSKTGRLYGKPTQPVLRTVRLSVTNAAGTTSTTFDIEVDALPNHLIGQLQGRITGQKTWLGGLDGIVTLSITPVGGVTGSLRTASLTRSFSGKINAEPATPSWTYSTRITRGTLPALKIDFTSPLLATSLFTASIYEETHPGDTATINGFRNIWSSTTPATTQTGTYEGTLSAVAGMTGTPPVGLGNMTIIISSSGGYSWSGFTADNTALSGSGRLSPTSQVDLWQALYSKQGQIAGLLNTAPPQISGTLQWKRLGQWSDAPTTTSLTR